ncbi:MAG: hypothetical protein KGI67_09205 [Pseudomonadota bacterium]|nr:hypothetical protein [Pseudomonadota bacterium]
MLTLLLGGLAGMAVGFLHFSSLHRVVRTLLSGQAAAALLLQLLRLLTLAALLVALARTGPGALLACLAGIIVARSLAIARSART